MSPYMYCSGVRSVLSKSPCKDLGHWGDGNHASPLRVRDQQQGSAWRLVGRQHHIESDVGESTCRALRHVRSEPDDSAGDNVVLRLRE